MDKNKRLKQKVDKYCNKLRDLGYNFIDLIEPPRKNNTPPLPPSPPTPTPPSPPSQSKSISDIVLFIRADDGKDVLNSIRQNGYKLDSPFASDLYVYTENMWSGENLEFKYNSDFSDLFNYSEEEKSNIPEMDFVMLHIHINKNCTGISKSDSANRGLFFENICEDKLQVKMSNRLPYNVMPKNGVYQK